MQVEEASGVVVSCMRTIGARGLGLARVGCDEDIATRSAYERKGHRCPACLERRAVTAHAVRREHIGHIARKARER